MRSGLVFLFVCLLACAAPPQTILPGKLDLAVASGDKLKLCPDDGVEDTTPDADCIVHPGEDAFGPYDKALAQMGWRKIAGPVGDHVRLTSPVRRDGSRACLLVAPYVTNFARLPGTLLEFKLVECAPA